MRGKALVAAAVVVVVVVAAVAAGYAWYARESSPARALGWKPEAQAPAAPPAAPGNPAGPAVAKPAAGPLAPDDPLLGFSRYLPADYEHYHALLQSGRLWRAIAGSRAAERLTATREIQTLRAEFDKNVDLKSIPPEGRTALELAAAAFDSEVVVAFPKETSEDIQRLIRAMVQSAVALVPGQFPPGSPQGKALARKRRAFRDGWIEGLKALRIPPVVFAARVRDEEKFNTFVTQMLDRGWQAAMEGASRDIPPEIRPAVERAYAKTTIGGVTFHRFRLRIGDVIPEGQLEGRGLVIPVTADDFAGIAEAIRGLTVDVHLGFLGEYLTLVVASDDAVVRAIVERYEGRAKDTLAASKAFERIRAGVTPDTIGVSYSDGTASRKAWREDVLPLLEAATDPELLGLLGVPPQVLPMLDRIRSQMSAAMGAYAKHEALGTLDRGVRSVVRSETDLEVVPLTPGPLATPGMTPADALGYSAVKDGSMEGLWDLVRNVFEQQDAALAPLKPQAASNPRLAAAIRQQETLKARILGPIEDSLAPALKGEIGFALGAPVSITFESPGFTIPGVPVPPAALIVHSPDAGKAIQGVRDLLEGIMQTAEEATGGNAPMIELARRDVGGIEIHALEYEGPTIGGLEPHLARVGNALVFSTSLKLTRQLADAAAGRAPAVATGDGYRAMADCLDPAAWTQSFLDGARVNAALGAFADGVFATIDKNEKAEGMADEDRKKLDRAREFTREIVAILGCFRGHAESIVRAGSVDTARGWGWFEDVH